jgi:hypothetical protein
LPRTAYHCSETHHSPKCLEARFSELRLVRRPDQYAIIGRIIYEDTAERPDVDLDGDGRGDHAVNPLKS